jgi:hypothetical protein
MTLSDLMDSFESLPGADVGQGHDPRAEVDKFLARYPALTRDRGYVEFLRSYAGASLLDSGHYLFVDIFGFTHASTQFSDIDAPVVDEDGFLIFATVTYQRGEQKGRPDTIEFDFAFDVSGERSPVVYRYDTVTGRDPTPFHPAATDFVSWLVEVVDRRGVLHDYP